MDILDVQKTVKLVYRFANTSPERFTAHWDYQSATLIVSPGTKVWLAANNVLSSRWTILAKTKLGPKPKETPVKAAKEGMKPGILNTKNRKEHAPVGILNRTKMGTPIAVSNRGTTALVNFRFSPEVTV